MFSASPSAKGAAAKSRPRARATAFVLLAALALPPGGFPADGPEAGGSPHDPVMSVMQAELKRATAALTNSDPAPYYLSYTVYDQNAIVMAGAYGSLPFGDDPDSLARVLWELTDRGYKRASPAFLNVKTNTALRAGRRTSRP